MTDEVSGPFESSGDGLEEADWLELEDAVFPYSGYVANYADELEVSEHAPSAAMSVDVATGAAVLLSSRYRNKVIKTVTIDAADSTQDRYDLVVIQRTLNAPGSTIIATVHKGDLYPAGTAVAPSRTTGSPVHEIVLATVFIAHGTTAITTAMIVDKRTSDDCGAYSPVAGGLTIDPDTGDFDFDGQNLVNIADPSAAQHADTKAARDAAIAAVVAAGLSYMKNPCVAATTADVTIATALNNGDTIDGVTLATGDRVLVCNQTSPVQNGIYVVGATPSRATDYDSSADILGSAVCVIGGTKYARTIWMNGNLSAITMGSTPIYMYLAANAAYLDAGTFTRWCGAGTSGTLGAAGSYIVISADSDGLPWRFYAQADGPCRFYWDMKAQAGSTTYGKLYVNGVSAGSEKTTTRTSFEETNDSITLQTGDYVELYYKTASGSAEFRWFRAGVQNAKLLPWIVPGGTE